MRCTHQVKLNENEFFSAEKQRKKNINVLLSFYIYMTRQKGTAMPSREFEAYKWWWKLEDGYFEYIAYINCCQLNNESKKWVNTYNLDSCTYNSTLWARAEEGWQLALPRLSLSLTFKSKATVTQTISFFFQKTATWIKHHVFFSHASKHKINTWEERFFLLIRFHRNAKRFIYKETERKRKEHSGWRMW